MRINRVVIKNFRCYYGKSTIDFNSLGKITLIYGDSGYGKSSFLQFFRWIFYNDPDFGKNDDKPLFNIAAYKESDLNDHVEVKGIVDFEHLGVKYSLEKSEYYSVKLNMNNTKLEKTDYVLQYLDNNSWMPYGGDISKKINSIMPKGLSKYFLLDGEKARDIVLNSSELKLAINALFGIDAYERAIDHLGSKYKKKSVIGYYNNLMTSQIKSVPNSPLKGMTPAQFQDTLEDLHEEIENNKDRRKDILSMMQDNQTRKEEILKILGEANNKGNLEQIIKQNNTLIKNYEKDIDNKQADIGTLFYRCFPFLLLTGTTSQSTRVLRESQDDFRIKNKNLFNNLKKDLLKEILEHGECVCGRHLDDESISFIQKTINTMPPNSYTYQFGQFVSNSKEYIQNAGLKIYGYDDIITDISDLHSKVSALEEDNKQKLEELKRLGASKDLIDELETLNKDFKELAKTRAYYDGEIAKKKQTFNIAEQQLKKLLANIEVSNKYTKIIAFFTALHNELEEEKKSREDEVAVVLNECVRSIFKKLTTQTDLDVDKIQFVNKNFSLRTTYLTGGQLAIDEYSYVIGIVKALQQFKMDNNENPIIIDAPFAFTGNEQSEHIFETLPSVVKQTVLLTLDLNKIKRLLNNENLYEFYVIKNESQDKAVIERGDINDIEF